MANFWTGMAAETKHMISGLLLTALVVFGFFAYYPIAVFVSLYNLGATLETSAREAFLANQQQFSEAQRLISCKADAAALVRAQNMLQPFFQNQIIVLNKPDIINGQTDPESPILVNLLSDASFPDLDSKTQSNAAGISNDEYLAKVGKAPASQLLITFARISANSWGSTRHQYIDYVPDDRAQLIRGDHARRLERIVGHWYLERDPAVQPKGVSEILSELFGQK
jgi:hypothetical protein